MGESQDERGEDRVVAESGEDREGWLTHSHYRTAVEIIMNHTQMLEKDQTLNVKNLFSIRRQLSHHFHFYVYNEGSIQNCKPFTKYSKQLVRSEITDVLNQFA